MAAGSSTKMQGIRTSIPIHYPRSAGGPTQRLPHRAPFQHYHSIPTSIKTLLLSTTTTTLSCLVHLRPKVLIDRMVNPRASETHHHQNRLQKQRRRKFGCSKLSWPRHGLTPRQLLHWRRSVSRSDLAGALIDYVRVGILLYFFYADCFKWEEGRNLNINVVFSHRCGCSRHDAATWCIACQSQQGGAQGDSSRVCE
jgi:hypothetical protein